eukprot:5603358-Prymnesium_polylepis.1
MSEVQGERGQRGEGRWGLSSCCGKAFHSRCLARWISGSATVKAPCQEDGFDPEVGKGRDRGTYDVEIETKKQCVACRKPLTSSQSLLFD